MAYEVQSMTCIFRAIVMVFTLASWSRIWSIFLLWLWNQTMVNEQDCLYEWLSTGSSKLLRVVPLLKSFLLSKCGCHV